MHNDQQGEPVDLVSLLRVRDLIREWGRHARAKPVSKESLERFLQAVRQTCHGAVKTSPIPPLEPRLLLLRRDEDQRVALDPEVRLARLTAHLQR